MVKLIHSVEDMRQSLAHRLRKRSRVCANMADKKAKGRQQRGERVPNAKLTETQVRAIRADSRIGKVIGPEYGISHRTVWDIKRRKIWQHVT